ncbi:hypothetical protein LDENG_00050770 [Lucifuga dentata]|nr:hypothetical protein LDENG_00050770 [Lucifuga dentata]
MTDVEAVVQAAQVTVGLSDVIHQLQMESVIPQPPQFDRQGHPVLIPLDEVPHETLPACFLLKLQPPIPMISSFVHKLSEITGLVTLHSQHVYMDALTEALNMHNVGICTV